MKIGIFDSGIGGYNVVKNIIEIYKGHEIYYFADTARLPYGDKTDDEIKKYSEQITSFLLEYEIEILIIACNTASAISLEFLKNKYKNIMIFGVIDAVVEKVLKSDQKKVAILATSATINSNKYQTKINNLNKNIKVRGIKAPLLVPLIENNLMNTQKFDKILLDYLKDIINDTDVLVLGCTHYSLFKEKIIKKFKEVSLIDSSYEVSKILPINNNIDNSINNKITFFVSGDIDQFNSNLENIFNLKNQNIIKKEW